MSIIDVCVHEWVVARVRVCACVLAWVGELVCGVWMGVDVWMCGCGPHMTFAPALAGLSNTIGNCRTATSSIFGLTTDPVSGDGIAFVCKRP